MKIFKLNEKDIADKTSKAIIYSGSMFGCKKSATGKGISVAIIGTGLPTYQGFSTLDDFDVMVAGRPIDSPHDEIGCTTALAGFICANGSCGIHGLAQSTRILSLKSFVKNNIDKSTVMASILWGIIKKANIIVLPFEVDIEYKPIQDALKKAIDRKIIVLSVDSPKYKGYDCIFPVIPCPKKNQYGISLKGHEVHVTLPIQKLSTSFGDKLFVKVNRQTASLGLAAGAMSLLLENNKNII